MQSLEGKQRFTNPLVHATSPYLRQHAGNPVYWYPWGPEALTRARAENKPILLSIGYSTCYWCHVMEREVFENVSIAALMNRCFINIKLDREEHPGLDEIYMVARQLMTHEGGWPNNVFLTPDLKPFFAGGTFGPADARGRPGFPRLLEWLNHEWVTKEGEVRKRAHEIAGVMQPFLVYAPSGPASDIAARAEKLFAQLKDHHDSSAGGFFQAPKFPHESYLQFLLQYYESGGDKKALDMAAFSLGKMAAGGIYDQVACGFHRYAVDKEWYVPHFEKMLYNQAQLARVCVDAARLTGNPYFADIARGTLDFVSGPMTAGVGAFYSAIDAETDGVEGDYYAWTAEELQEILTEDEAAFFTSFYALADIPAFPGHKHARGQVIVARQPLDIAAREKNMPYDQLAAMGGQVMNKLLAVRNRRKAPNLDDKIITGWNGMMIDAFAHAGRALNEPKYVAVARKAADYLLATAINNNGQLCRLVTNGRAHLAATLEDYAFLVKGLISVWRATPEKDLADSAALIMRQAEELFADPAGGYFFTQPDDHMLVRIKSGDDSAIPNANAAMLHNLIDLHDMTGDAKYLEKAKTLAAFFLRDDERPLMESSGMATAALRLILSLQRGQGGALKNSPSGRGLGEGPLPEEEGILSITASLSPENNPSGDESMLLVTLHIKEGWHINPGKVDMPSLIPTQLDVSGEGVTLLGVEYPEATMSDGIAAYIGTVTIKARLAYTGGTALYPALKARLRFQPCTGGSCHAVRDISLTI